MFVCICMYLCMYLSLCMYVSICMYVCTVCVQAIRPKRPFYTVTVAQLRGGVRHEVSGTKLRAVKSRNVTIHS